MHRIFDLLLGCNNRTKHPGGDSACVIVMCRGVILWHQIRTQNIEMRENGADRTENKCNHRWIRVLDKNQPCDTVDGKQATHIISINTFITLTKRI